MLGRSGALLLAIDCRILGKRQTFRARARAEGTLKMPLAISAYSPIPAIGILHATYGSKRNRQRSGRNLGQMDVTREVRERMRFEPGGKKLTFRREEGLVSMFGDPAPGLQKELTLTYGFKERRADFVFQAHRGHFFQDVVIGWPSLQERTVPTKEAVLLRPFAMDASATSPAFFTVGGTDRAGSADGQEIIAAVHSTK